MIWPFSLRAIVVSMILAVSAGPLSAPAAAQIFEGPGLLRFGVFGQGNFLDLDYERTRPGLSSITGSPSIDGGGVGLSFGYDWRFGNGMLIGLEADGSISNDGTRFDDASFAVDFLSTFRGRLGAYARPGWLLYATVGLAVANIEYDPSPAALKEPSTLVGWTAGAGTEVEWHGVLWFGEYLYTAFEEFQICNAGCTSTVTAEPEGHLFRLGAKFKIGFDY